MVQAKNELNDIEQQMMEMRENIADEQGGDWFDDSSIHTEIEFLTKMAERQRQFVQNLEMALVRIKNNALKLCLMPLKVSKLKRKKHLLFILKMIDLRSHLMMDQMSNH